MTLIDPNLVEPKEKILRRLASDVATATEGLNLDPVGKAVSAVCWSFAAVGACFVMSIFAAQESLGDDLRSIAIANRKHLTELAENGGIRVQTGALR